jgi:site-specific DNA-cytosine methylase
MENGTNKINNDGLTVLSLFDGISCCLLALEKNNIKLKDYYSSEIDKHALMIQKTNLSADTRFHQIGDVRDIKGVDYANIDLICAGSPCTQLSAINSKDRSGLDGEESSLFYEFIRIIKEIRAARTTNKPLQVLLENVWSMKKSEKEKITKALSEAMEIDIEPIFIDSAIVAPAHRRRLYWTNIPYTPIKPVDIKFKDIIKNGWVGREKANVVLSGQLTLTSGLERYFKMNVGNVIYLDDEFGAQGELTQLMQYSMLLKNYGYNWKEFRGNKDEYAFNNDCYRVPSVAECEALMTIPEGWVSNVTSVSKTAKYKAIGLGMTVDVIVHLLSPLKNHI